MAEQNKTQIIDEILERSVKEILPTKETFRALLLSGKKIRFYIGTDPTGTSLHLGHATNYMVLEKLRKLGHEAIFLIGDFTARIGDPTDKGSARKQLSRVEVRNNVKTWLKQISPIVDFKDKSNPVKVLFNHDWLSKLKFEDVVNLASNFTVQQMLERDMFEKRIEQNKPIHLHEFFYPLMQGYDSVAMDVDMEICGNDQKFNALAGRTLLRKIKNKEKFVFITTLLENPVTKEKMMSKSLGTGVFLDQSAESMYGGVMAQPDENIPQLFTDCTYVSLEAISKVREDLKNKVVNPRDIKMLLAYEIVKIYHGEAKAVKAQEVFINTFQKKEIPIDMMELVPAKEEEALADVLVKNKILASKSDFRRLVKSGAVTELGSEKKVIDPNYIPTNNTKFKVGKKIFIKITFKKNPPRK